MLRSVPDSTLSADAVKGPRHGRGPFLLCKDVLLSLDNPPAMGYNSPEERGKEPLL